MTQSADIRGGIDPAETTACAADPAGARPVALVTGVGRRAGIGAALVAALAEDGWDIAFSYWNPYDDRMDWGRDRDASAEIAETVRRAGGRVLAVEADLAQPEAPAALLARVGAELGDVRALVMAHCESVDSSIMTTTLESFDRHFAVNARAAWLLIRAFAEQFASPHGTGRILALTSDHTAGNLPYGASKGALDRITIAAAHELADLGITANAINPGPVQTGWISPEIERDLRRATALGRLGRPADTADLVAFLCSARGGWINGQLLHSDGGFPH
jgi:3-oxoacyl-[acyl-carrier protein] reductase